MYIKEGNIHECGCTTTNERSFNAMMNELAGTRNVTYSGVWPMHVSDGQQYLKTNKHNVARVYAGELHGRVKEGSVLALRQSLVDKQRTALSYLRQCGMLSSMPL